MKVKSLVFLLLLLFSGYLRSQLNVIQRCNIKLVDVMVIDIFSPLVASRNLVYPNIAAYEVLASQGETYQSISRQIRHMPMISKPLKDIDKELAAQVAFVYTAKTYIYSEDILDDFLRDDSIRLVSKSMDPNLIANSYQYGLEVAKQIIDWSKTDNYALTRTLHRNELADSSSAWTPTPPEYQNGLEPNWKYIRKMTMDSTEFISSISSVPFSLDSGSQFYKQAYLVYETAKNRTQEQTDLALYWDDNPMTTISKGHLTYVVKKPSPGGHWMKILSQLISLRGLDIYSSSELYTLSTIGMFDAFIHCWKTKYESNLIRPETYIQRLIDPKFAPLIETPPFPEYTSGHSVVSACIAEILNEKLGRHVVFTDSAQIELGMNQRQFQSFDQAANEASMSRLCGGIHYLPALVDGAIQGRKVARHVLSSIHTRR